LRPHNTLGHIACRRKYSVLAVRADKLLKTLKHARLDHSYEAELRKLLAVDVLVVDDFALDAMDATESRDMHEILTERDRACCSYGALARAAIAPLAATRAARSPAPRPRPARAAGPARRSHRALAGRPRHQPATTRAARSPAPRPRRRMPPTCATRSPVATAPPTCRHSRAALAPPQPRAATARRRLARRSHRALARRLARRSHRALARATDVLAADARDTHRDHGADWARRPARRSPSMQITAPGRATHSVRLPDNTVSEFRTIQRPLPDNMEHVLSRECPVLERSEGRLSPEPAHARPPEPRTSSLREAEAVLP
jgi:hypothetical protein